MADFIGFCNKERILPPNAIVKKFKNSFMHGDFSIYFNKSLDLETLETEAYFIILRGFASMQSSQHDHLSTNKSIHLIEKMYSIDPQTFQSRLLGNYSIYIYMKLSRNLVLVSDHMSTRTTYYVKDKNKLIFSSKVQLLREFCDMKFTLNTNALIEFMSLRVNEEGETLYNEVKKILPNTRGLVALTELSLERYTFVGRIKRELSELETFSKLFENSVSESCPKQHPIGVMLSGGLDSSAVSIALRNIGAENVKTFSGNWISVTKGESKTSDETKYQLIVADQTGYPHYRIPLGNISPVDSIEKHSEILGFPFHFSNIYLFEKVALTAKKHNIKVIFDGNDGDNVVSHGFEKLRDLLESLNVPKFLYESYQYSKYHNIPVKNVIKFFLVHSMQKWRLLSTQKENNTSVRDSIFRTQSFHSKRINGPVDSHKEKLEIPLHANAFEMKYLLFQYYGLETRSPFYNQQLIKFCISLPNNWKLKNGRTRYILRRYLENNKLYKISERPDKAILTHGLIEALSTQDIKKIESQINNLHPTLEKILDKNKLKVALQKLKIKTNAKDIDATNILAFYSMNIWLHRHY